jgi:hypothetical protein
LEEIRRRGSGIRRRYVRRSRDRGDRPTAAAKVCQQVFEEAAVDCGRALAAWSDSRSGKRPGKRVGFPRLKKKGVAVASFRLRNKHAKHLRPAIRVGDNNRARSVTLPGIGQIEVSRQLLSRNTCGNKIGLVRAE